MKIYFAIFLSLCISNITFAGNFYQGELLQSVPQISGNECKEGECLNKIEKEEERLPSPIGAAILAVFPGILFHGMGHFYINENLTGLILVSAEGIGVFLGVIAAFSCANFFGPEDNFCFEAIPGAILFWGGWLYDVIGAPIKASNMRKEYEKKKKEKENILKPEIGLIPLTNKAMQSSSGEVSFLSSYYKVQDTLADLRGGVILLTWKW